jgi:cobalt/nickel transport system ATP-binding protein
MKHAFLDHHSHVECPIHHLDARAKIIVLFSFILIGVSSMDSEILALGEPTDNLDPAGGRLLIERIRSIPQTKVIVTHHLPAAVDLCERAVLLYEGRKTGDLSMGELLKDRSLLERFGFDADYAEWMWKRNVKCF